MPIFTEWLDAELTRRGWSQSEAARRGGFSHSLINQVMNGNSKPGIKLVTGIAHAFQMQPDEVMRLAGILPPKARVVTERRIRYRVGTYTMTERVVELFERLNADQQELVVRLLETLADGTQPRIIGDAPEDENGD